ncbi:hypothetical protein Gotur_015698, partial [Gossypium turneri]
MPEDENGEMSTIPGLNQIQLEGFCGFMDLTKTNKNLHML